jgi:hypothetical protein
MFWMTPATANASAVQGVRDAMLRMSVKENSISSLGTRQITSRNTEVARYLTRQRNRTSTNMIPEGARTQVVGPSNKCDPLFEAEPDQLLIERPKPLVDIRSDENFMTKATRAANLFSRRSAYLKSHPVTF